MTSNTSETFWHLYQCWQGVNSTLQKFPPTTTASRCPYPPFKKNIPSRLNFSPRQSPRGKTPESARPSCAALRCTSHCVPPPWSWSGVVQLRGSTLPAPPQKINNKRKTHAKTHNNNKKTLGEVPTTPVDMDQEGRGGESSYRIISNSHVSFRRQQISPSAVLTPSSTVLYTSYRSQSAIRTEHKTFKPEGTKAKIGTEATF